MSLCPQQQLEPSPAESKDSYESVEGRRVKPGDHKAPDHSPPSSDPGSVSELDRPTKPPGESVDPSTKPPGESPELWLTTRYHGNVGNTCCPDEETNVWTKIWMYIKFIWAFLESAMVTITKYLNRNSRDYRYVVRMLALEKKMLKEDSDFGKGTRNGPSMVWQPLPSLLDHKKLMNSAAAEGDSSDSSQQLEVDLATMKTPRLDQAQARSSPVHSSEDLLAAPVGSINRLTEESQGVPEIRLVAPSLERGLDSGSGVLVDESDSDSQHELSAADQPPVVQLCIAIYYSLMSHSELICYFMVFLHQIKSATILSLPLPLMVFLWGTLTVPRPTKTFWVTLIAYTETIVVVKCLFQFDLIPWNIRPILDNQPFFPPRIIGIEQKPNYATYDLALLLIIFFHRVMLKSMGLWKSSYEDPIRFPKKEEMFALDSSGSDEQQTKAGEEFSDLQPSKLCESLPPIPNESNSSALHHLEESLSSALRHPEESLSSALRHPEESRSSALRHPENHFPLLSVTLNSHFPLLSVTLNSHFPLLSVTLKSHVPLLSVPLKSHVPLLSVTLKSHVPLLSVTPKSHVPLLSVTPKSHVTLLSVTPKSHYPLISVTLKSHFPLLSVTPEESLSSALRLRRGSAGSKSSSVRQVVTQGGRRLSAIRSVEDLEGETSTDLPTTQLVVVETERESALVHFPAIIKLATVRYFDSIRKFFENLMVPSSRVTADVYTYMFLCDFFNFLVVVVGIESFGTQQGDGGVTAYLEENKVPIPFLLMLILQFALIVIDRALYLRKHILGKIMFQFLLVVGIHIWMQFNAALPPQMWYMVKSFYLLLSAYQIRCGYPTRILGNVLCKRYNILNYVLFKGYLLVPFLFELRTIMDWVWTNTTMTLMDWLKMEDIFNNIFQHKCARRMESEYPQPRGERKNPTVKYLMGGGALVVIIGILWFPLVLFALGNTVGKPNLPYDVTLSLRIGPYQPVYTMSAQNNSIYRLSDQQWTKMANAYKSDRVAQTFLSGYDSEDVGVVALGGNSTSVWGISPPDMDRLILEVASANPIVFKLAWKVSRASNNPEVSGVTEETREWVMEAVDSAGNRNPQREVLANMLGRVNSSTTKAIIVQDVLPKFVKVTNRNTVPAVKQLMGEDGENEVSAYRNLSIRLYHDSKELWWELKEAGCDNPVPSFLKTLPFFSGCKQLVIYTFNEKAFPAGLSIISGGGIIGLYTTLVLIASNVIRGNFTGICNTIMFDDMPNVDRILQVCDRSLGELPRGFAPLHSSLCLDIYLVRESGEFALEEDLFAKLVFLYRSPETLIKWSRPPEEGEEEADGERPAIAQ
uniref:Piezo non-specific cation channel R-Ras-binding domain-containing protein n=1 Tax=Timema monikensis TaxID=170555 RepID=A0A7R9EEP8_9NEOP|nr:unnamed protein product [Timema monikensis]